MLHFIAKYYSSLMSLLTAPFRSLWRGIKRFFPERDVTVLSMGNVDWFHQSPARQFFLFMLRAVIIIWAGWSTYVFAYHRPLLQRRTRQLEESRTQHAQQMSELQTYAQRFSDLHKEINAIDDQLINSKKLSQSAADALVKKRIAAWAQIEVARTQMATIFANDEYVPTFTRLSEMNMEYELTTEENRQLRARNRELEDSMIVVASADETLVSAIGKIADGKMVDVNKSFARIKGTLSSLGLGDLKVLANAAVRAENPIVGAALPPIEFNMVVDEKYLKLAEKIELGQNLMHAEKMLPLGAPVPGARTTSAYGGRADPIDGTPSQHRGIDFAGKIGTPLLSVAPGRVTYAGEKTGYGRVVEIDHGMGFTTLYGHLSRINVVRGDVVKANEVVGLAGSSGRSTGPHLHYEIRYKGNPFNPINFVKGQ